MNRNSLGWFLGIAVLVSACGNDTAGWIDAADVECDEDAFPGSFLRQSGGLFTVAELADRGIDGDGSANLPMTDGLRGGYFSFWKELADSVPFDQPGNVVCQAMLFDEPAQAAALVESLEADAVNLSRAAISWPADNHLAVTESNDGMEHAVEGTRAFVATGTHRDRPFQLTLLFAPVDQYVVGVHAGGPDQDFGAAELAPVLQSLQRAAAAAD